jgi:hypothetical protein
VCGLIVRAALIGIVVVVLAVVAGFGAGVALERSGSVDPVAEPDAATVRDAMVVTVDCPGGNPVVALGRADRILVTGRDEERDWVELRSPIDLDAVVWLPAAQVDLRGAVGSLPVHTCGAPRPTPVTIPPDPADDRPRSTTTTTRVVVASTSTTDGGATTTSTDASTSSTSSSSTSSTTSTSTGSTLFPPTSTTTTTATSSTTQPGDSAE